MSRCVLSIAGLSIEIQTPEPLPVTQRFAPFLIGAQTADYTARFTPVPSLPKLAEAIHKNTCLHLHPDGQGGLLHSFRDPTLSPEPYAVGQYLWDRKQILVDYLPEHSANVLRMDNCFYHLAFGSLLLREQRAMIHAALLDTPLGGLLFCGPSGIGKSTQARLWQQHRDARLINGDRPILSFQDGRWLGWGAPYAGSSRCYVNESRPISAVILLQQGNACALRRLDTAQAFSGIFRNLTVDRFDRQETAAGADLAVALASQVPVVAYTCPPDAQAVVFLEQALTGEGIL